MSQKWLDAAKLYHATNKATASSDHKTKMVRERSLDEQIQIGVALIAAFWESGDANAARKLLLESGKNIVICEDSSIAIELESGGFYRRMKYETQLIPLYQRISYSETIDAALECGLQVSTIIPNIISELDRIADAILETKQ